MRPIDTLQAMEVAFLPGIDLAKLLGRLSGAALDEPVNGQVSKADKA